MTAMEETEEALQAKLDVAPTYEERAEIRAKLRALRAHKAPAAANGVPGPAARNTAASATRPTQTASLSSASQHAEVAYKRPAPKFAADMPCATLLVASDVAYGKSADKAFARSVSLPSGAKTAGPASDAEQHLPFGKSMLKPTTKAPPAAPHRANSTPSSSATDQPEFMNVALKKHVAPDGAATPPPRGAAAGGTTRTDAVGQRSAPKVDSPLLKTTLGNRATIADTSVDGRKSACAHGPGTGPVVASAKAL